MRVALAFGVAASVAGSLLFACSGSDSGNELQTGSAGSGLAGTGGSGTAGASAGKAGTAGSSGGAADSPCDNGAAVLADGAKTGAETCDNGATHLAEDVPSCPFVEAPGVTCSSMGGPPGACSMDADCGPGGRCELQSGGAGQWCACRTTCKVDADCPGGSTCVCGPKEGRCVATECKSDADCKTGLCLSVHQAPKTGSCGTPPPAFACTSATDGCIVDADCGKGSICVQSGASRACVAAPPECPPVP